MMRARLALLATGIALVASPAAHAENGLIVSVDRATVATKLGHTFVFHSRIENGGPIAARGLVAHLNIVDLSGNVYVDPEDWSAHRTRYLDPIRAGGSTIVSWKLEAVNSGTVGVYVAVLPRSGAHTPPATSPTIRVRIQDRKTLNAGGILPLALAIPGVLGLVTLGVRFRRARDQRRTGS